MGGKSDVFAHAQPVGPSYGPAPFRQPQEYVTGETAGAVRSAGGSVMEVQTPANQGPALAIQGIKGRSRAIAYRLFGIRCLCQVPGDTSHLLAIAL